MWPSELEVRKGRYNYNARKYCLWLRQIVFTPWPSSGMVDCYWKCFTVQVCATKNLFWERRLHVSHAIQAKMAIHFQCYWRPQIWQIDKRDSNLTSQPTGNCYCFLEPRTSFKSWDWPFSELSDITFAGTPYRPFCIYFTKTMCNHKQWNKLGSFIRFIDWKTF